MKYNTRNWCV